ncbi:MAG: ATP-binding cassette domain-containing protein [Chloroflexota bacterium]|nr:ATP-binding cassette domain-containing protein [Chloroflexota bacterium]
MTTRGETMDAIITENLTKTYKNGVKAVNGVSFTVRPGEIFGLLGPNGAGKSTTVRILATLTYADGGTARVAGHDVRTESEAVRRRIGYVAQASGVDKYQTGRENLVLQGHLLRVPGRELGGRVEELLELVGLTEAANRTVQTYSGGMKRRLDLALGLIHRPSVLFLDEPTTGLDPETRAILWQDLQRLRREQNLAVLLTTHYLEEADQLCDRLAIIDHGRVVVEGTPGVLKSEIRGDAVTLEVDTETSVVAAALRPLDGVLDVIPNGASVIARVTQGATAIPALVTALEQRGVGVQSVSLSRPSLDDVYLHYTGHRFSVAAGNKSTQAPATESGREGE